MLHFIFTIDYEIFGDGRGSLEDHVLEPAWRMIKTFEEFHVSAVFFIESAEFQAIEKDGQKKTQLALNYIKQQIEYLYKGNFEVGLHLHPQWFNAAFDNEIGWLLDLSKYNLCLLPKKEIRRFVKLGIRYLQEATGDSSFTPLSYRGGNWLMQPTRYVAEILFEHGIRIDSSVFKGGFQAIHGLDYRPALSNGPWWKFKDDVNIPDKNGILIEIPIHTEMVPVWKMLRSKRLSIAARNRQKKGKGQVGNNQLQCILKKMRRLQDFCRIRYPLKLDFCRMNAKEFNSMVLRIVRSYQANNHAEMAIPVVAIGHTKDFVNDNDLKQILSFMIDHGISISTFAEIYPALEKN